MDDNYSKLMTMKEARSFLHVSNTTIRRWVEEGKLPAYKTEGGHRRFFKEDLLKCVGARGYRIAKKNDNWILQGFHCRAKRGLAAAGTGGYALL